MSADEKQPGPPPPEIDPELDIRSKQFNPLKALYAQRVPQIVENARVYDNLALFEPIFKREFSRHPKKEEAPAQKRSATTSKVSFERLEHLPTTRRFTAEQQPIQVIRRTNRRTRNILDRMTDATKLQGPLQLLYNWREQHSLVKIYTRNEKGVDGHVIGHIEAFDKHWNLVVSNAQQTIKRRKNRYCYRAASVTDGCDAKSTEDECLRRLASLKIHVPEVKYVASHGRNVTCERTVPQLLVRGEHVVTIVTTKADEA